MTKEKETFMTQLATTQEKSLVLHTEMIQPWINVIGQVAPSSKQSYTFSAITFYTWLLDHQFTLETVDRSGMIAYRDFLAAQHAKATAARKWSVACQLLRECQALKQRGDYPAANLRGFKVDDASPHIALSHKEAHDLLLAIDTTMLKGKRDYTMMYLLIRTGIRRAECAALNLNDFVREQGHTIMTIRHGKGDQRRKVKVPVDVFRAIEAYIDALRQYHVVTMERKLTELEHEMGLDDEQKAAKQQAIREQHTLSVDAPLFIGFDRGQHPTLERLTTKTIERIVAVCGKAIDHPDLTPHDLRTTFNTLSKKGGATLEQRQHTMGHKRPETTQRYDRDKDNLDDSAVDYVRLFDTP